MPLFAILGNHQLMTWKQFVARWRPVNLTRLGIPPSTVFAWRDGKKEPKGWHRDAAAFWIEAKAGEKLPMPPVKKSGKPGAERGSE